MLASGDDFSILNLLKQPLLFCIIQKKKTLFFETDTFLKRIRFVTVFFFMSRSGYETGTLESNKGREKKKSGCGI